MHEELWWLAHLYSQAVRNQLEIHSRLQRIEGKVDQIMALAEDLKAGIKQLDDETTVIGTVISALVAKLQNSSITDAEKADVFTALSAVGARLTTLGVDPTNPVPPPPPPMVAAKKLAKVP